MQGEGTITIPMQFMADIRVTCEVCGGKRFKKEVLDAEYRGKNIYDMLRTHSGRGYHIPFGNGWNAGTANNKETETSLGRRSRLYQARTVFVHAFRRREPARKLLHISSAKRRQDIRCSYSTNLQPDCISTTYRPCSQSLTVSWTVGNTVIVIEHNMDVIKSADHIIDIGPEGRRCRRLRGG